ncbi:Crp/Fnr family transcriptional regulator [Listeria weihenstephanensis]|uniref:Crp/Fnr family transcriptional regulator n=1 Tax=Listeria weihenstephanensis TaxID=1006155 RepID=A0A841Z3H4_9LIST|nr:Crp/Fnr family transcriptional regulator [Listeria weihenstephanensis]MBC1499785.1 Crp/Fnr family transcriptional regulator [Listeria weihenstephanensis]
MPYLDLFDKDVVGERFSSNHLFNLLQEKDIYEIESEKIQLARHEILFYENKVHDYMYIIESGIFGAWRGSHIMSFVGQDGFIGLDSILGNDPSFLTVVALTKAVVWRFSKEEVMRKLMYMQEGLFFLYNDMKRTNEYLINRSILQVTDAKERIKIFMIQLGKTYGVEKQDQIILPKIFTKKIISNYLNLTSTTVYYICKELIKEGFLEPISYQLIVNKMSAGTN